MRRIHSELMPREMIEKINSGYQVGVVFKPSREVRIGDTLLLIALPLSAENLVWEGLVVEVIWVVPSKDLPGLKDGYVLTTVAIVR